MRFGGAILGAALAVLAASAAVAEVRLSGEITTRADYYHLSGDESRLPGRYRHDGWQMYQEAGIRGSVEGDGTLTEFRLSGVLSESDYRTEGGSSRLEWVHLRHENASGELPFRLDLGDQVVQLSPLTVNQRLQAVRLEAQPGESHSLVWLSGRERSDLPVAWDAPAQRGLPHQVHGASWLYQPGGRQRYALNLIHQQPDAAWLEESSVIASLGGAWESTLAAQTLATALELATQDGRSLDDAPAGGRGLQATLRGEDRHMPLEYDLAYRQQDEGFLPLATDMRPDSRALDATAGYRLPLRLRLQGRYHYHISQRSSRRLETDDYGFSLESPDTLGRLPAMNHVWDLRRRERADEAGLVESRATEARWTVRVEEDGDRRSSTRLAAAWLDSDDRTPRGRDFHQHRLELSHRRQAVFHGMDLSATPGLDYRRRGGHAGVEVLHPTFQLAAVARAHRLALNLGYRELRRDADLGFDEYGVTLNYRYRLQRHSLGLEYDHLLVDPVGGEAGEGWRAGIFWRYDFDHPAL